MSGCYGTLFFFFFNDTATTEIYTLSLHDALPISASRSWRCARPGRCPYPGDSGCLVLLDPDLLAAILADGKTLQFAPKGSGNLVKQLAILGSTGSIGRQCLAVVESLPGRFGVVALAAGANLEELTGQIARLQPEVVSVADARRADDLAQRLGEKGLARKPEIHHGREGMLAVATHSKADVVVSAAVGVVGLEATYEAVKLGKTVALSNKEVLVAAGGAGVAAAQKRGGGPLFRGREDNTLRH